MFCSFAKECGFFLSHLNLTVLWGVLSHEWLAQGYLSEFSSILNTGLQFKCNILSLVLLGFLRPKLGNTWNAIIRLLLIPFIGLETVYNECYSECTEENQDSVFFHTFIMLQKAAHRLEMQKFYEHTAYEYMNSRVLHERQSISMVYNFRQHGRSAFVHTIQSSISKKRWSPARGAYNLKLDSRATN